ncbi:MAG: hypothetical protein CL834_06655 [Crocinitomicaceae bacterium]|jgi:hypothetical protein|nr:hypothetical protein [Crocinitomicaceae bacterium]
MSQHFSRSILTAIVAFFVCLPCIHVEAQTTASPVNDTNSERFVRLVMNDGSVKLGQWLSEDADVINLDTRNLGELNIPKYLVAQMMDLTASEYDRLSMSRATRNARINPQSSRYFFAPSGIQLKQGEGYFQSNIALNSVSIGVTDNVTIGGLLSFVGAGGSLKIGKEIAENVHASFGGIGFKDYIGELDRPIGLMFANITWGTEDRNLTVNIGTGTSVAGSTNYQTWNVSDSTVYGPGYVEYEYTITEYTEERVRPLLLNVSGMVQISDFKWLITENYFIRNMRTTSLVTDSPIVSFANPNYMVFNNDTSVSGATILSIGVRNLSRRNGWLWDYGMVGVIGSDFGFGAPWVSATLPF